jgi:hypothetical protein
METKHKQRQGKTEQRDAREWYGTACPGHHIYGGGDKRKPKDMPWVAWTATERNSIPPPGSGGSKTHANIIANPQFVAIDLQTDAKIAQIKGLANHILFTCTCVVT